jgi:hypothetical protein
VGVFSKEPDSRGGIDGMEQGARSIEKGERRKLKVLTTEDTEFVRSHTELAWSHGPWRKRRKEKGERRK